MKRRNFLKMLGAGLAALVAAPLAVLIKREPNRAALPEPNFDGPFDPDFIDRTSGLLQLTHEQEAAFARGRDAIAAEAERDLAFVSGDIWEMPMRARGNGKTENAFRCGLGRVIKES